VNGKHFLNWLKARTAVRPVVAIPGVGMAFEAFLIWLFSLAFGATHPVALECTIIEHLMLVVLWPQFRDRLQIVS
jgi:hypothetical protein